MAAARPPWFPARVPERATQGCADGAPTPLPVRLAGQAADASCASPALAVLIYALTAGQRAANPEVEIYAGLVAGGFVGAGLLLGLAGALAGLRLRRRRLLVPALLGLLLNGALAAWDAATNPDRRLYLDVGRLRVYRVREPSVSVTGGPIVVYLRGAGGTERQGLGPEFARLHAALDRRGGVLACPRDPELGALLPRLHARYGDRPLVLVGASMGGRHAYDEACEHPERYAGLVLLCPAVHYEGPPVADTRFLPMPVWIVCGDRDEWALDASRGLARDLAALGRPVHHHEIPGGDHGAPLQAIDWDAALDFVLAAARRR